MNAKEKQAAKEAAKAAKGKPGINPIEIPSGSVVGVETKVPGKHDVTMVGMTRWQPAEGINLLTAGENAVTHQAFAGYPLATSKTGRLTGKLMNIGDYTLMKTGKAFVQRQADAIKAETGKTVDVLSAEEKKVISDEMNDLKKRFFQEAKQVVAAINAHPDAQIRRVAIRKTASGGMAMTAVTVLERNTISEVDQLRRQLKEANATNAELKKHVNPRIAKNAETRAQEQVAHEVEATVQKPAAAAAPVEGATPEPAGAAPTK